MRGESLIHSRSLSETVDAVNEAFTTGVKIPAGERTSIARRIASRQGLPGAYADTFAGFESERKNGIKLFTGERVNSASARHILGEEACRVLRKLGVRDAGVRRSLGLADEGLMRCLERAATGPRGGNPGVYCCGKCTVGLWRNLASGGLDRQEERLSKGTAVLPARRDGKGGWRAFPFWYTVLLLSELELPGAKEELRYAAKVLEGATRREARAGYGERRRGVAVRALEVV